LDTFPLYICQNNSDKQSHDSIVQYVDKLLKLYKQKNDLLLSSQLRHIETEIEHYENQIDQLVCKLYGVSKEKIEKINNDDTKQIT
jgi:uncharacterized protein Yka (UPF0111/DUF47 family)